MVNDQTLAAARRLHRAAARQPRSRPVPVDAGDVLELLNAFWAESKRADVAEAFLERTRATLLASRHTAVG